MTIDDLKFVRLDKPDQFSLIPRYLFEQVKGADFIIDRLYQYGPASLASPLTFLYVLAVAEQVDAGFAPVKGVLWANANPYTEKLVVNTLSIDKEYQGNGVLAGTIEFLHKIKDDAGLRKLQIITTRPRVYEQKYGAKRTEDVIVEA